MTKKFKITGVDCANCAAKMEKAIGKLDGITEANLSFMTQKLIINLEDTQEDRIVMAVTKACKKIDRHVVLEEIN